MKTKTQFLLATSAIVGVAAFSATPAFAAVEDATDLGTALTTTPIVNGTDGSKDLVLTTTTEQIDVTEAAVTLGDSSAGANAAIEATDASGTTELTITNSGASAGSTVTIDAEGTNPAFQRESGNALNVDVESVNGNTLTLDVADDVNLSDG